MFYLFLREAVIHESAIFSNVRLDKALIMLFRMFALLGIYVTIE